MDRSGSLAVQLISVNDDDVKVKNLVNDAIGSSFSGMAIAEEFIKNFEISVEYISYQSKHYFLNTTQKITTGAPHFVEIEHHQPAKISKNLEVKIKELSSCVLDVLEVKNGASHIELMIDTNENIWITEVASRMGEILLAPI